jgi:hypothetical protein
MGKADVVNEQKLDRSLYLIDLETPGKLFLRPPVVLERLLRAAPSPARSLGGALAIASACPWNSKALG